MSTPLVLVDKARLLANVASMAARARRAGVAVRPHVKTHKSARILDLQLQHGAVGATAAKPDEVRALLQGGSACPSFTVAYPMVDAGRVGRLLEDAAAAEIQLRFVADSLEGVAALGEAGAGPVFLKVDVGLHRCGLEPGDPQLERVAAAIADHPRLELRGLLSHAGHAYGAVDARGAEAIACAETQTMRRVKAQLEAALGTSLPELSVGATPTELARTDFEGVTEIRPGNYVFMDRTPVRLGLASVADVALTVLTTVVSVGRRHYIVDAGSKVLSSDKGAHGTGGADGGYGLAYRAEDFCGQREELSGDVPVYSVTNLSEEHGWLSVQPLAGSGPELRVGDQLRILPNHSCPVVNLARELHVVSSFSSFASGSSGPGSSGPASEVWPVEASGAVQ